MALRHLAGMAVLLLLQTSALAQNEAEQWPLTFTMGKDQVQVFKPQPESYDGSSFTARAAVALLREQDSGPIFGAIWGSGTLAVDRTDRMGTLTSFKVTDVRFPDVTEEKERLRIQQMLSEGITLNAPPIPIDWLVAALEEEKQIADSYDNTPPEIIYQEKPGILLYIDGDPIMETVKVPDQAGDPVYAGSTPEVQRVVNTPFFLVKPKGESYWLYGAGLWYSATGIDGPWKHETRTPAYLMRLASSVDSSYTDQREFSVIPEVVVRKKPAVLLDLNGAPQFQPFDSGSLMYATNTDKDLFMDIPTQEYYILASGRWYATKDLANGPWRHVPSDALPVGFTQVPEGSAKDGVLAHVAGTNAAREAVRDASIPQTARVDRRTATVTVSYDGSPQFERIAGTDVYSAVNASTVVLRIKGRYYVVDNAVWFEGNSPDGPWAVSTSVPAEVNSIPASDPNYRVRYVYIYDYTPDAVFIGYTPGYLGSYVQAGTVIYGTGYYYNPWYSTYWYPRPYTWGFNMYYNPWYGWGFGASWGYNWFYPGWIGYYRPYSWGWWGPYAYCPPIATWYGHPHYWHGHYWPGTGRGGYYGHRPSMARTDGAGRPGLSSGLRPTDLYRNRPTAGVTPTVGISKPMDRQAGRTTPASTTEQAGKLSRPFSGDYFTDRQGNVYRTDGAQTEQLQNGRWTPVDASEAPAPRTNRTTETTKPVTRQPVTQPQQETSPARTPVRQSPDDPGTIRQERMRGDQRVDQYRGYQQQRQQDQQRAVPQPPRQAPQRTAPAPSRSTAPMTRPSAPPVRSAPSAPSHGGGGGGTPARRPR